MSNRSANSPGRMSGQFVEAVRGPLAGQIHRHLGRNAGCDLNSRHPPMISAQAQMEPCWRLL